MCIQRIGAEGDNTLQVSANKFQTQRLVYRNPMTAGELQGIKIGGGMNTAA